LPPAPARALRGRWWTLRGHRADESASAPTTERSNEQAKQRSPLTDSNRRHPPYIRRFAVGAERTRRMRKLAYGRRRGRYELSALPLDPSPPVSGGERAFDPLSVAAGWLAAVLREGA